MRLIYIVLFILFTISLSAQKLGPYAISSVGQVFETETVSLYVSIGEPINTRIDNGAIAISQGILQVIFNESGLANSGCANNSSGTLFFEECDDGTLFFFIRTMDGKVYDPYYADGVGIEHTEGELAVNFGFIDATFPTPCSNAEKAILITCIEAATATSTDDWTTNNLSFTVQPNPSTHTVQVVLNASVDKTVHLQLFDVQGKLLLQKSDVEPAELVDISMLPEGMYYLSLTNELQQRKTIKLVKQ